MGGHLKSVEGLLKGLPLGPLELPDATRPEVNGQGETIVALPRPHGHR